LFLRPVLLPVACSIILDKLGEDSPRTSLGIAGNLDSEVTHEELRRLFDAFGEVVQVHIIVDRDTGLPRGFAFVEMTSDAGAEKAIKGLNGSMLRDRTLDVN
jgi:RNA recognition motif-containing protein